MIESLARKLRDGQFAVVVELEPPRGHDPARLVKGARLLLDAGADAFYVSDAPQARLRMSAWAACRVIADETSAETILGFPTRGRNLLRIQGDLLGAHALGIRALFVCMGDPAATGDFPDDVDHAAFAPSKLIKLVTSQLNNGFDGLSESIGSPTDFKVACALDLSPSDVAREIKLLARKVENGADFAICQPVFSVEVVERFRAAYEAAYGELRLPLIVGAWPIFSLRNAEYLNANIPGINVPTAVMDRLAAASVDQHRIGIDVARELVNELRGVASGAYIFPPFRRYEIVAEVLSA